MKKLDVYVEEFKAAPTPKDGIGRVLQGMLNEVVEEVKRRNAYENAAICAVIDEQDLRWRLFLKRIGLEHASEKSNGAFMDVFGRTVPEAFVLYNRHKKNQQFIRRARR